MLLAKNEIGLRVAPKVFAQRFAEAVTEDTSENRFQDGELRGKIKGKSFYFYKGKSRPQLFATLLRGEITDRDLLYCCTKNRFVQALVFVSCLMWFLFSMSLCVLIGPPGLLGFLAIPAIMIPCLHKKKEDIKTLEDILLRLGKAPIPVVKK